ncbi:RecQ family ATP-dependent DNA helicase [soil metagenome]
MSDNLRSLARTLLRDSLNAPEADFRDGQWEAIATLVEERSRLLVVQRTGWGKSVVYFIATALLRQQGAGPTLLVSPLLALMRNQIEAAERIGIRAVTINSTNVGDWEATEEAIRNGEVDILLISPERLANRKFRERVLNHIAGQVGLFVVDEAHCISDWGHDFRPDYRRIVGILERLPDGVPVLATTATANERVVRDVEVQLGRGVRTIRGPLGRSSLRLQATFLPHPAQRLAWLAQHLPEIDGSGVVYVRTIRDAERVAEWLRTRGIDAAAYYGSMETEVREELERKLLANGVKALVATNALGMGFDKPDLGFVVHYQRPGSVVAYYQQVGRAGRAVEDAYGVLLSGTEDDAITDYFIESAFPPIEHTNAILKALEEVSEGLKASEMEAALNLSMTQIGKVLRLLDAVDPPPIEKLGVQWHRTPHAYTPDLEHVERLIAIRKGEQEELHRYMSGEKCLMAFLREALDDPAAEPCGRCEVCVGEPLLSEEPDPDLVMAAPSFLNRAAFPIRPRKQKPDRKKIPEEVRPEEGREMSLYREPGLGWLVYDGRETTNRFDEQLVKAAADLLAGDWPVRPEWVTCVPSLRRPDLVPDVARRIAERLGLPFAEAVRQVRPTQEQRHQQNSHFRMENLRGAYAIDVPPQFAGRPVLLVDDIVDSGWTMAVVSGHLRARGAGAVYPLALAMGVG